jgi:hypothetical protein
VLLQISAGRFRDNVFAIQQPLKLPDQSVSPDGIEFQGDLGTERAYLAVWHGLYVF